MGAISPQYVNQQHANLQFQWEVAVLYYAAGQPVLAIPDGADVHATMQGFDSEIGSFVPNVPGIYQFDLFITDDYGDTVSDRVTIRAFACADTSETSEEAFRFERFLVSPNPFDDQVRFGFIGEGVSELLTVIVFDLSGHRVWEGQTTDAIDLVWDGQESDGQWLTAGPYVYKILLMANGQTHTDTGFVFIIR
jgi:hypothetical protein